MTDQGRGILCPFEGFENLHEFIVFRYLPRHSMTRNDHLYPALGYKWGTNSSARFVCRPRSPMTPPSRAGDQRRTRFDPVRIVTAPKSPGSSHSDRRPPPPCDRVKTATTTISTPRSAIPLHYYTSWEIGLWQPESQSGVDSRHIKGLGRIVGL